MFIVNEMFYNFLYREERLKKAPPKQPLKHLCRFLIIHFKFEEPEYWLKIYVWFSRPDHRLPQRLSLTGFMGKSCTSQCQMWCTASGLESHETCNQGFRALCVFVHTVVP